MNIYKVKNLSQFENIQYGFFDRTDGYSTGSFKSLNVGLDRGDENAFKNREKIATYFGIKPINLITLNQVHSTTIHVITKDNISDFQNDQIAGDGLVTNIPGILIGVYTADCIPLLMYDNHKKYIATIHCGWRGAFKRMLTEALTCMRNLGCENLTIASGAFIHKTTLSKNDVPQEYRKFFDGNNVFDLKDFLYNTMKNINFEDLNINTFENNNFFSYRRFVNENCNKTSSRNGVQFSGIMMKNI